MSATIEERVAALERLRTAKAGPLDPDANTYPTIDAFHKAVTDVMERDVWTHELGNFDSLIAEVKSGEQATFHDVLEKIPAEKRIVIAVDPLQPVPSVECSCSDCGEDTCSQQPMCDMHDPDPSASACPIHGTMISADAEDDA